MSETEIVEEKRVCQSYKCTGTYMVSKGVPKDVPKNVRVCPDCGYVLVNKKFKNHSSLSKDRKKYSCT